MNRFTPTTGAWFADSDCFPEGCAIEVNAHTGQRIATGPDAYGLVRSLHLDVALCSGCDKPLDAGVCHDCEQVFVDVPQFVEVEHLGPGRIAA